MSLGKAIELTAKVLATKCAVAGFVKSRMQFSRNV